MSTGGDDRDDTLLDRMEYIAEVEEEDDDEFIIGEDDDESFEVGGIFGLGAPDGDNSDDDSDASYDGDEATPLEYHWTPNPAEEDSESASYTSEFQGSGLTVGDSNSQLSLVFDGATSIETSSEDSLSSIRFQGASAQRGSFSAPRRFSSTRFSFGSTQSAPTPELPPTVAAQRRVTISVPNDVEGGDHGSHHSSHGNPPRTTRHQSKRRQSVSKRSMTGSGAATVTGSEEFSTSSSKRGFLSRKKSTRRTSSSTAGVFDSMHTAISTLGQGGNSEWENVAAAAAVVAAGTACSAKRSHVQFAVDEKVLVFLNILNHTNSVDSMDAFTVNPVNKFGYPRSEGKTNEEQQGPYVYVLAAVKKVHFDEDLRYYTVARADSGTEQRADTAWMEQVKSPAAVDAATRAARQTSKSEFEKETSVKEDKTSRITAVLAWPVDFAKNTVIPLLRTVRATAKEQIELLLYGHNPYSCTIRATGINLLVLCSFIYLFLEVITLAFLPASADFAVAVITILVWSILALELLLEYIIRPPDYFELIQSERAYAPSTARNIDSFHLFFEMLSLVFFIPEFVCIHDKACGELVPFSGLWASVRAVLGPTKWDSALGRFCLGLRTLRIFSLARHWKKMWINNTFRDDSKKGRLRNIFISGGELDRDRIAPMLTRKRKNKVDDEENAQETLDQIKAKEKASNEEDQRLKKAATIGTSLMVVNSHRALFLLSVILIVLPMIGSILGVNSVAYGMTDLLQQNNIVAMDCDYLELSIDSWIQAAANVYSISPTNTQVTNVLWAQISPSPRGCAFLNGTDGVITGCRASQKGHFNGACEVWDEIAPDNPDDASPAYFADKLDIREGGITEVKLSHTGPLVGNFTLSPDDLFQKESSTGEIVTFTVRVLYNQNHTVAFTNAANFLLLLSGLILCLFGLAVLRGDAGRLVLHPLQRMLKIVVRYAENPLSQSVVRKPRYKRKGSKQDADTDDGYNSDNDKDGDKEQLGNYETEQLINAISKIADLLRKCWGVAGAGIISSNLARTQDGKTVVFNPTVAGRQVYALFGFVTINGFSDQLRALDRDVMILINDVAGVVHDEVYRWALGDSGQCNKNLGSSFLMVFRIGDFKEVHEKQARATDVVFSSNEKRAKKSSNLRRRKQQQGVHHGRGGTPRARAPKKSGRGSDTLQLASLPGIQAFSDRALLGMLKSFAGIHRERELTKWKRDFRLGAGVGAYVVNIIIGMDAGWAVEGAVGSEYKIDATYLSPHVNMAARMMSATKQYGVTILLSQAVEELLSSPARAKLRHLDTVYVKGSSVSQRIFTYDARHRGVDFFLFERAPEQADLDAESYTPMIWENDQDLRAMRQHVTDEFTKKFKEGKDLYLSGEWKEAIQVLQDADDIMITTVLEQGYIDYNPDDIDGRIFNRRDTTEEVSQLRGDLGDGGCKCLIAYMQKRNGTPPDDWKGVRPLTSK